MADDTATNSAQVARAAEFTDDHIQHLLRNADRLGFGIRPEGFVLINRARLIEEKGISKANAGLMDQWVAGVGGGVQALQRQAPNEGHKRRRPVRRLPDTMVWGIPADALRAAAPKAH